MDARFGPCHRVRWSACPGRPQPKRTHHSPRRAAPQRCRSGRCPPQPRRASWNRAHQTKTMTRVLRSSWTNAERQLCGDTNRGTGVVLVPTGLGGERGLRARQGGAARTSHRGSAHLALGRHYSEWIKEGRTEFYLRRNLHNDRATRSASTPPKPNTVYSAAALLFFFCIFLR